MQKMKTRPSVLHVFTSFWEDFAKFDDIARQVHGFHGPRNRFRQLPQLLSRAVPVSQQRQVHVGIGGLGQGAPCAGGTTGNSPCQVKA